MSDASKGVERRSLFKELVRVSLRFWPALLLITLLLGGVKYGVDAGIEEYSKNYPAIKYCIAAADQERCMRMHATEVEQETQVLIQNLWPILAVLTFLFHAYLFALAGISYGLTHFAMERLGYHPERRSWSGFWYYIKEMMWKYTRPLLWNFIPVLGTLKYIHSLYRYQLVGPMAVLNEDDTLQKSWDQTDNQFFRIVWADVAVALVLGFILTLVSAFSLAIFYMSFSNKEALEGVMNYVVPMLDVLFGLPMLIVMLSPAVTYDVLTKEKAEV